MPPCLVLALALAAPMADPPPPSPSAGRPAPAPAGPPDYKVVFWADRGGWHHRAYDVRRGQYTPAVDAWVREVPVDPSGYVLPGRMAFVRDVRLSAYPGPTEAARLASAIKNEYRRLASADLTQLRPPPPPSLGPSAPAPSRPSEPLPGRPALAEGPRPALRPLPPMFPAPGAMPAWTYSRSYLGPAPAPSPFPYPYPRPHP